MFEKCSLELIPNHASTSNISKSIKNFKLLFARLNVEDRKTISKTAVEKKFVFRNKIHIKPYSKIVNINSQIRQWIIYSI